MPAEPEPESFLSGANSTFLEDLYGRLLPDADAVAPEWQRFFQGLGEVAKRHWQKCAGRPRREA